MKKKVKAVFLRGLTPENHKWVKEQAKRQGYTLSGFINRLFQDAREHGN